MNAKKIEISDAAMDVARRVVAKHGFSLEVDGKPWLDVLAEAHAEIVSAMVLAYGGQVAAEHFRQAAQAVENMPTMTEVIASAVQQALDAERDG